VSLIHVVTDCEFDGPTPGENSLLSFASVALASDGTAVSEFETVIEALPGAAGDPANMAFWERHPEAWAEARRNPKPPAEVMTAFVAWVRSLPGEQVFAAHPLAIDGPWIDYYLRRFAGTRLLDGPWVADRLFRHMPLCLMSMVAGRLGIAWTDCDVSAYPPHLLGQVPHTHRAIDDARGYANLLRGLWAMNPASLKSMPADTLDHA
jgi:hypothetical protein